MSLNDKICLIIYLYDPLVEILQQDGRGVVFPAELVRMLNGQEAEIRHNQVSDYSRSWLAGCGLTVEHMEEEYEPERRVSLRSPGTAAGAG